MKNKYFKFWIKPFVDNFTFLKNGQIWTFLKNVKFILLSIILVISFIFSNNFLGSICLILSFFIGYSISRHIEWNEYKNG